TGTRHGPTRPRDTASSAPLSLHDALPICRSSLVGKRWPRPLVPHSGDSRNPSRGTAPPTGCGRLPNAVSHLKDLDRPPAQILRRSAEHTPELQSRGKLVCRLLLAASAPLG